MKTRYAAGLATLLLVSGGCEERHGFLKVGGSVLLNDDDRLACGEAQIAPKSGYLDAFMTLKPQECTLTLHRNGDFLGLGTEICKLHVDNNKVTSVYLYERRGSLSCGRGSD